ncbi:MAG: hypothetical protein HQL22_11665, partial [Candidatus Omnitrophica bacterium]|nr:hypothetical protein [Candidatus Omnitrophota bacterium]
RYFIKDGKFDGVCMLWHENGKKRREETFVNGQLNGLARTWYENGSLKTIERFERGELAGMFREWDQTGKLARVRIYIPGRLRLTRMDLVELKIRDSKLTALDVITERNLTLRRILMEYFGNERLVQELGGDVVEKDGERELIRVNLPKDVDPLMVVKVRCPSTGTYYMLRVPPTMKTAREAVAWTFGIDEDLYELDEET